MKTQFPSLTQPPHSLGFLGIRFFCHRLFDVDVYNTPDALVIIYQLGHFNRNVSVRAMLL